MNIKWSSHWKIVICQAGKDRKIVVFIYKDYNVIMTKNQKKGKLWSSEKIRTAKLLSLQTIQRNNELQHLDKMDLTLIYLNKLWKEYNSLAVELHDIWSVK